jgi:hypothetical protein
MAAKETAIQHSKMPAAMPINVASINDGSVLAVQVVNFLVVLPSNNSPATVVNRIHRFLPE